MQPAFVSAAKITATLTPALRAIDGVITITGIGDHLRPEWPITITGMRIQITPAATILHQLPSNIRAALRETRRGRPSQIVLGDPMREMLKLLPEPGELCA
jgi:hypothetical protein